MPKIALDAVSLAKVLEKHRHIIWLDDDSTVQCCGCGHKYHDKEISYELVTAHQAEMIMAWVSADDDTLPQAS